MFNYTKVWTPMGFLSRRSRRNEPDPVQKAIVYYAGLTLQEYVELDSKSKSTVDTLINLGFLHWDRRKRILVMTPDAENYVRYKGF